MMTSSCDQLLLQTVPATQNITLYKVQDTLEFSIKLLLKLYEKKHRIIFLHDDLDFLKKLDECLWTFKQSTFIPHVLENSPLAAQTPIVLKKFPFENINGANTVVMINREEMIEVPELIKIFDDQNLYAQEKEKYKNAKCWIQKNDIWTKD